MAFAPRSTATEAGDAELITAVRGGDRSAYAVLYERHRASAYHLARQLVTTATTADDIVSEGFAKVFDALIGGRGPDTAFRAYLLTSVRNTFYDAIRRDKKVNFTDDMERHDKGQPFVDTAIESLESSLAARAFSRLPERWQTVLWHTEIEGETPAEVAPVMGMTANGVAALAYRAREGLRQAYLQEHVNDTADAACQLTTSRLGAWARNGLSKRELSQVEGHLKDCDRCAGLAAELADLNSGLRGVVAVLAIGGAGLTAAYLAGGTGAKIAALGWAGTAGGTALAGTAGGTALTGFAHVSALIGGASGAGFTAAAGTAGAAAVAGTAAGGTAGRSERGRRLARRGCSVFLLRQPGDQPPRLRRGSCRRSCRDRRCGHRRQCQPFVGTSCRRCTACADHHLSPGDPRRSSAHVDSGGNDARSPTGCADEHRDPNEPTCHDDANYDGGSDDNHDITCDDDANYDGGSDDNERAATNHRTDATAAGESRAEQRRGISRSVTRRHPRARHGDQRDDEAIPQVSVKVTVDPAYQGWTCRAAWGPTVTLFSAKCADLGKISLPAGESKAETIHVNLQPPLDDLTAPPPETITLTFYNEQGGSSEELLSVDIPVA